MSRSGQEYSAEEQRAATGKGGVVVAMHASASNQAEVRLNLELDLISGLTVDPSKIPIAREIVDPAALSNAEHREILRALYRAYTAGVPIDLSTLVDELDRQGRLAIAGGPARLAEIWDGGATGALVENHARRLLRFGVEDQLGDVRRLLEGVAPLEEIEGKLRAPDQRADLNVLAFFGDRLRAVRGRPEPVSPLPGFLDPAPHLHLNQGKPKTGKTTLALKIARDWALGVPPWPGAPALPGTRALVISRGQPVVRIDGILRRLSVFSHAGGRDDCTERIAIIARDPELSREARALMTLDEGGLRALRAGLMAARQSGAPFGLVVLDSLSRLKPLDVDENDTNGMAAWLDEIEDIAVGTNTYVMLIHHLGHSSDPARSEARSAGRGSSTIGAVAQAAWLLERVPGSPRQRLLKVDGNELLPAEYTLEVCGEKAEPGSIRYFRRVDPLDAYPIDDLVVPGEEINMTALAWRTTGREPEQGKGPGGAALKMAGALAARWQRDGLGAVHEGPRRAKVFTRAGVIQ
jgi:hypothetical protein